MASNVIMPRQGQSVESCIITKWHKKIGEAVAEGDALFSYETDKASFDEEAKASGTLLAIFFEEGEDVPCLTNVAAIGQSGEDVSAMNPAGAQAAPAPAAAPAAAQAVPAAAQVAAPAPVAVQATPAAPDAKAFVSPRARMLASQIGLDARMASPSGPNGRVIERDIRALQLSAPAEPAPAAAPASAPSVAAAPPQAEYEDVKLPNVRKVIGKAMMASLSSMAQLTLQTTFDASTIIELRKTFKASQDKLQLPNITLNDMLLFAVSRVLKDHRDLNAHFLGEHMRYFTGVHLGMAVDTPRGLLVPTLFNADSLSLAEIAAQSKALAKAAQEGAISPDNLKGGSFTITNLGALGVELFTPIINPPQTGILGVGNLSWRMREADGEMIPYQAMGLSLTFDHRALDGAPAARFLQALTGALENFTVLLAR